VPFVLPIKLGSNQPPARFYLGGRQIAAFRDVPGAGSHVPEDWVGSVTTVAGEDLLGLTVLPNGRLLRDELAGDPVAWLGRDHVDAHGADPLVLVKLLDAGQRLPVHAHPDDAWASSHVGHAHGKAEAWYILEPGEVFLGLREAITSEALESMVAAQDVESLLGLLHRREVARGDTVYVPPGTLHAIGEGTFLAEVQQPEDLSILLEWRDFEIDGAVAGHLGVGFATAITAIDRRALVEADVDALITSGRTGTSVLSPESSTYFRADHHVVNGRVDITQGFAILIVTEGDLELVAADGSLAAPRGSTILVPHAAGRVSLAGHGAALLFRPPDSAQRPARP
jgi:mannose-6-phosphate isomerase